MASDKVAIDSMLLDEGGQWDASGPSKFGVLLSEYQKRVPGATVDDIKNMTRDAAVAYYQLFYWMPNFSAITDQSIANKLFSTYVNMWDDAVKFVQRGLRDILHISMDDDGVFGSKTLAAVNTADPAALLNEMCVQQAVHYAKWYAAAPGERDMVLRGMMERAFRVRR